MRLRVELVTKSNKTIKTFLSDCKSENVKILDSMETGSSIVFLVSIDIEKGRRLFLPCRSIIEGQFKLSF
jgi:hypothetical protein